MRQRLALAAALLPDPDILILDEPTNGLDPEGVRWLRGLLRGFAAEGGTVLLSSHLLAEAAQTIDAAVIVDHGRLVAQGPLDELAGAGASLEDTFLKLTGAGR
jgi:ABC-2 type transport system ATP-binding protein